MPQDCSFAYAIAWMPLCYLGGIGALKCAGPLFQIQYFGMLSANPCITESARTAVPASGVH